MEDGVSNKNVEQPPSAVLLQGFLPLAKPAKGEYRRNLPHLQAEDKPIYVTFCTYKRWHLPESVRSMVIRHCLHDHGIKLHVHGIVVMPDHVHMIFTPLKDKEGKAFGFAEIMNGIKGASAHSVNKALHRKGPVWQYESFDHVLRSDEKIREKVEYICQNPIRKGLVEKEDDYPWLWREWMEGEKNVEQAPSPAPSETVSAQRK
jgi:REP element-mobilizing transposase RayT